MTDRLKKLRRAGIGVVLGILVGACEPGVEAESTSPGAQLTASDWSASGYQALLPKAAGDPKVIAALLDPDLAVTPDLKTLAGIARRVGSGVEQDFKAAEQLLSGACDAGQMRACRELGQVLIESSQDARYAEAASLLRTSCDAGIQLGCGDLVPVYVDGIGVVADATIALKFLNLACAIPGSYTCAAAADSYAGVDFEAAIRLLGESCEEGEIFACHWAGLRAGEREDAGMAALAVKRHDQACALGLPASCMNVLDHAAAGDGKPENLDTALRVVDQFCRQGDLHSCYRMSRHFQTQDVSYLEPDMRRGLEYWEIACEMGDPESCRWLAEALEAGTGVPADAQGALDIYSRLCDAGDQRMCQQAARVEVSLSPGFANAPSADVTRAVVDRACELGDGEACRGIAWWHVFGEQGREKNVGLAAAHFRIGCDKGAADACIDIGSLNEWAEHGFTENKAAALAYYKRACDLGEPLGCQLHKESAARAG